jgi:hypothetical protein
MTQFTINWIDKPGGSNNPHTHIRRVGGSGWGKYSSTVITDINMNLNTYHVNHGGTVQVGVGVRNGAYYLRTKSDGTPLDNLLSLSNIATD